jgi:hypothetical protein
MKDERDPKAEEHAEDLEVPEEESDEVKGGAWYAKFDGVDGTKAPGSGPSVVSGGPGAGPR